MQEPSRRRAAAQRPPELEDGVVAQQWDVAAWSLPMGSDIPQ